MKGVKRNVLVDAYYADGKPAIAETADKTVYQENVLIFEMRMGNLSLSSSVAWFNDFTN